MAVGKPVIQGLDKALSTSKEAFRLKARCFGWRMAVRASEAKKVEDAKGIEAVE